MLLRLPVLGHFRSPSRFTLLTSLGLCLLGGRGFDRALPGRQFWSGYAIANAFAAAALAWGLFWSSRPNVLAAIGVETRAADRIDCRELVNFPGGRGGLAFGTGFLLGAYPTGHLGADISLLPRQHALGLAEALPRGQPRTLPPGSRGGCQAGRGSGLGAPGPFRVDDRRPLPRDRGPAAELPPRIRLPPRARSFEPLPWARRFGVTHGVWEESQVSFPGEVVFRGEDPLLGGPTPGSRSPRFWRMERYPDAFPEARACLRVRKAKDWYELFPSLAASLDPDEVWFLRDDLPPEPAGPRPLGESRRVGRPIGRGRARRHL